MAHTPEYFQRWIVLLIKNNALEFPRVFKYGVGNSNMGGGVGMSIRGGGFPSGRGLTLVLPWLMAGGVGEWYLLGDS